MGKKRWLLVRSSATTRTMPSGFVGCGIYGGLATIFARLWTLPMITTFSTMTATSDFSTGVAWWGINTNQIDKKIRVTLRPPVLGLKRVAGLRRGINYRYLYHHHLSRCYQRRLCPIQILQPLFQCRCLFRQRRPLRQRRLLRQMRLLHQRLL